MKEIGSEFWNIEKVKKTISLDDLNKRTLLSGRTALDYILKDIKAKRKVKIAYVPSYCCNTMIEPFIKNNIKVLFYDVIVSENGIGIHIDKDENFDIIYLMEYFGFVNTKIEELIRWFKRKNKIVIEDRTHSYLSRGIEIFEADYIYGSLRKWTGLYSGAFACKKGGEWNLLEENITNERYISLRKEAFDLKKLYVDGNMVEKSYLNIFAKAEKILEEDYVGYAMDDESKEKLGLMDEDYMAERRILNGRYLLSNLEGISFIKSIYNDIENSVPLFVPIIVNNNLRDKLRKYLIDKEIYCPIHWDESHMHNISFNASKIYKDILSIVCDQRYSTDDMERIIKELKEFENDYVYTNNKSR